MFDPDDSQRRAIACEFHACSLKPMSTGRTLRVAGLFAGIGGLEWGLATSGAHAELLCEWWEPAQDVLRARFPEVPIAADIRTLRSLPAVDLLTAGFPCTDLSQAGMTRGIEGSQSGLVAEVFRLLRRRRVPFVLLENVRNMLVLDGGRAMRYLIDELEGLGYRWAYRLVDSRFSGVPQRRQRVILLAARHDDPRAVLLADDAGQPPDDSFADDSFGFYWTEGLRGLGWAQDAVPTLKGGSTIGIPSPPAIWNPDGEDGRRFVLPAIDEAEVLQGFPPGWTEPAGATRRGVRWKLVGNAVTVGVAAWVGTRLQQPGTPILDGRALRPGSAWPTAGWGAAGKAWAADVSMWPTRAPYQHLRQIVDVQTDSALSVRGAAGFLNRAERGHLRFVPGFLDDLRAHIASGEIGAVA